jgi:dCTP deaminase
VILGKKEILKAIKKKKISIKPFNEANVGPASVDVTLGTAFRVFKNQKKNNCFPIVDNSNFIQKNSKEINIFEGTTLSILPGELVLGTTAERICLSPGFSGRIEGRSRFARMGLLVHVSSGFIQPGVDNVQVLEIVNVSKSTFLLKPGVKICQIVFEEVKGTETYCGKFKKQLKP